MKKIPKKYGKFVFILLMTFLMGASISFINTWLLNGWTTNFLQLWLTAFIRSYLMIIPTILLVLPIVQKIIKNIVEE